jgi:hypothetical protein
MEDIDQSIAVGRIEGKFLERFYYCCKMSFVV